MSQQAGLGTLEAEAAAISGHLSLPARISLVTSARVVCPLDICLFLPGLSAVLVLPQPCVCLLLHSQTDGAF